MRCTADLSLEHATQSKSKLLLRSGQPSRCRLQVLLHVAGFPLTDAQLGRSFAVTSGHQPEAIDWTAFQKIDTLVVLMVGRNLASLMKLLQKAGRLPDAPVRPV